MSVTTSQSRISYTGDGASVVFPFPYEFQNNADIEVWLNNVQQTIGFTVTGASNASVPTVGGDVTFTTPPAIGSSIVLIRNPTTRQNTVLSPNDAFPAKTIETMVDAAMLAIQRLYDIMALQPGQNQLPVPLSYPFQEQNLSGVLPPAATRALSLLAFDQNGQPTTASIPPSVGAGNMTSEGPFVANVNFTPNVTTQLTLSQSYGSPANVRVAFDDGLQGTDQYSIAGNVITFTSPIPQGVSKVYIVGGTTLSIFTPAPGSVGDAQLNWGRVLARVCTAAAAVAALNPLIYQEAFATGFSSEGDGGGGAYYYNASSAATIDNATVLSSSNGTGRWLLNITGRLSAQQCGVTGSGTTDDTAAMQLAHNTGRTIYYRAGTYKFSTLSIPQGGIVGDGPSVTVLAPTDTGTGDTISLPWTSTFPPSTSYLFRDFQITSQVGKSTGNVMNVLSATHENASSTFDNVQFFNGPTQLCFTTASQWNVHACQFINYTLHGITVNNTDVSDSGDSTISDCLINTGTTTAIGVAQLASGGLKIVNTKFNGGAYGYFMGWTGSSSSDLLISNCSIENMTVAAISLSRTSGVGTFSNVVLQGIQIGICLNGISFSDAAGFLSGVTVDGVVISLAPGSGTAIGFNNTSNFKIGAVTIIGNGGSPTGLAFASGCANGKYDFPVTAGLTTPISNSSSSVFQSNGSQTGTVSIATSTAYGGDFLGTQAVTFATAYKSPPQIRCFALDTPSGGKDAFASGVSASGFTLNGIGIATGGSRNFGWEATGNI